MNESCHTFEWVMSHRQMSYVTDMNLIFLLNEKREEEGARERVCVVMRKTEKRHL